ncbi:MAG TPA: dCTP deaminase [Pirellulales bacterium]|nr:dCTP deaminase [Pirellulales bacterium]
MILCDYKIKEAIAKRQLVITPPPDPSQFDSTTLNLHVGDDFRRWRSVLGAPSLRAGIEIDTVNLSELLDLTTPLDLVDGFIEIPPREFVLVRTLERVELPLKSRLAARVEGRSTLARLGLSVHMTAPTIHAGFGGKITLEMLNHGPFILRFLPNVSQVCQLIIERVDGLPKREVQTAYQEQSTPLGTPRRRATRKK